jgi:hypothetical protein
LRVTRAFSLGALNNTGRRLSLRMVAEWRFYLKAASRLIGTFRREPAT